jgi:pullulanase
MYEQFGAVVNQQTRTVEFKLFHPDAGLSPTQYEGGGLPRLTDVSVVGSFQNPATKRWDPTAPVKLTRADFSDAGIPKGRVYSVTVGPLDEGFYEYKYLVTFENGEVRYITDPCARYGGSAKENAGFVVGGEDVPVSEIPERLPLKDLMIYELMIDDFTALLPRSDEAPLELIVPKLKQLADLGINAIEFMPWTAWSYPDDPAAQDFSWGYNPIQYFSVAHKYTLNRRTDLNKLVYLKRLINACHALNIHVIMDGVFNHADVKPPDRGFPYYWLYEDMADSPYVGNFAQADFFKDLDYANTCTLEYIRDACIYWVEEFKIDGFRLDNTLGIYRAGDRGHGLPKLLSELRGYLSSNRIGEVLAH